MSEIALGTKVEFSKSLSKQNGYFVDYERLTEGQEKELEENCYIKLLRWSERLHDNKQGFICGKRTIATETMLEQIEDEYSGWQLASTESKYEMVYLVACDMRGLSRVREQDLEVIS